MATKLKELEVTSVDFVDVGANPNAWISIFKRDAGAGKGTEGTTDPGAGASAGEPDTGEVLKCFFTEFAKRLGLSEEKAKAAVEGAGQEVSKLFSNEAEGTKKPAGTDDDPEGKETKVTKKETKGDDKPMAVVDVSKMTTAERAFYEDIVKRCSVEEGEKNPPQDVNKGAGAQDPAAGTAQKTETPAKADEPVAKNATPTPQEGEEDIYKGLHPAVAEELKRLRKRADEEDAKAIMEVAKKYEIIGKKPEELAPVLKSLKAAGGTAYDDMISVLDASVAAVNRSGLFNEIGKSVGGYGNAADDAWSKIEKKADEIQKANPNMNRHQAIDTACMQNPQLVHEYESGM